MSKEDKKDEQKDEQQEQQITPEMFNALQDSVSALEQERDAVIAKNREILQKLADTKKASEAVVQEAARKAGDIEALEKSWQEKTASDLKERDDKLDEAMGVINSLTVGASAMSIAAEIALKDSVKHVAKEIAGRLAVEVSGGESKVRVLDANGKPSAMTLDDLKKEISEDKGLAPLLVGSKASGSGDVGKGNKSGGDTVSRSAFDKLAPAEQMTHIKGGGKVVDD